MAYQLVEMMATDKNLQGSEFYPEYLLWKSLHCKKRPRTSDDDIVANEPNSKCKKVSPQLRDRKTHKTTGCVVSTATISRGQESMPGTCNINSNSGSNRQGLVSKELVLHEAKALASLHGLPGVPKLYEVVTEEDTPSSIMRYQSGTRLQEYINDGDIIMSLLAFTSLCKVLERIHKRGWAIYNLKPDNIQVHIDNDGMVCSTILDYSLCCRSSTNPHYGDYYSLADELPRHLPPDVLDPYCQGDLVDRFSLCRLCEDICSMMPTGQETNSLKNLVRRGLMTRTQHAIRRPKPRHLGQAVDSLQSWEMI